MTEAGPAVVNNTETWQIHSFEGELVAEYNNTPAAGTPTKEYGYRNGQLLVVFDNSETDVNQQLRWLVQDHLGSTRMEANLSGSLAGMRRHDYLPFGEELQAGSGAQRNNIGYEPPPSNVKQKFGI